MNNINAILLYRNIKNPYGLNVYKIIPKNSTKTMIIFAYDP